MKVLDNENMKAHHSTALFELRKADERGRTARGVWTSTVCWQGRSGPAHADEAGAGLGQRLARPAHLPSGRSAPAGPTGRRTGQKPGKLNSSISHS